MQLKILETHSREEGGGKLSGVVHSFDGTAEESESILDMGFYIGLNGW